jgi:glutathione S-transferase
MYTVLGSTRNRTLRVIWTLEELGVPYNQIAEMPGSRAAKVYSKTGKALQLYIFCQIYTTDLSFQQGR